jgi:DNA-binding NarL/FixJ family response regulator
MEVLRLVVHGCSNAAIAAQLVITERTVNALVSNQLRKPHLSGRSQVAIYA